MTDDELAMAYADGELDALTAKRFERRMADEPALADAVAAQQVLRTRLGEGFAPVAGEAAPDHLAQAIRASAVPFAPRRRPQRTLWAASVAAALAFGVFVGQWLPQSGPLASTGDGLIAANALRHALDRQLAGETGRAQILASFRAKTGTYCRIFRADAVEGVACHEGDDWPITALKNADAPRERAEYRQAASASPQLLGLAQDMMAGDPLGEDEERRLRGSDWQ